MRLIDAEKLKEEITADIKRCGSYESKKIEGLKICVQNVENAPTIDALEVVQGRWEKSTLGAITPSESEKYCFDCTECSVCKRKFGFSGIRNYCPNCGAKMESEGK